ncbi:hypothetical protein ABT127_33280 [Streptomyces sp. NPDC001904]|uniref:hypothetical protein n=1 Tax=Streptomyces sp. NPDC001904 TaxID=3154531 RepID=UPI003316C302
MQDTSGQIALPAYERAERLLRAGELKAARAEATAGLDADAPQPGLYLVLARAHAAEDDDDHDTAAERAYRAGLDAFPDDLDLLAGYAEFALAADGLEHPGRLARGRAAAERLAELAPDSPQARQAGSAPGPKPPSEARIQRHDVRTVLLRGVDPKAAAEEAAQAAAAWPHDRRLAVRAATLDELARPVAAPARAVLRHPYPAALLLAVAASALILTVTALELPSWLLLAVFLLTAPVRQEQALLRRARRRALAALPVEHREPAPGAPGIPPVSPRQKAVAACAALILVASAGASATWAYARSVAYPHYEAVAPRTFHGLGQVGESPALSVYAAFMSDDAMAPQGKRLFAAYGEEGARLPAVVLFGATGDLHDVEPGDITGLFGEGIEMTGAQVTGTWHPAPGRLGGRVDCLTFQPLLAGEAQGACTWADHGSFGTVLVSAEGMSHADIARTAAELRRQTLTPGDAGGA